MTDWEQVTLKGQRLPLPGGGSVEITDDTPVVIGDGFTYRVLTYRKGIVEAVFEISNGTPNCVRMELNSAGIRQRDIAAIKVDDIRKEVLSVVGIGRFTAAGEEYEDSQEVRPTLSGAKRRRQMTPDFLRQVAKVHDSAAEGRRLAAVVGAFSVHERTALRYIAQAKKEGYTNGN